MASTYVPPAGPPNATIAIVGEQPGRNEVRHRHLGPFSGPAGRNLQECLQVAGITWNSVYRTNVIKDLDAPLSSYVEIRSGKYAKAVATARGEHYIKELASEMVGVTANVIVACGNVALWALCSRIGITSWRGSVLNSTLLPGRKVVPTFHPATWTQEKLYENPAAYLNKYLVVIDLKRAHDEAKFPEVRNTSRQLSIAPTFYEACAFIDNCMQHATSGGIIDYDIETTKTQELSCIGLAWSPNHAMCIPFVGPSGDYFSPDQELQLMLMLEHLFNNADWRKRGQNVIFDSHFLLKKYGIRTHNLEDTMIAQGILWPEMPKALEFITSVWTDIPYYKADGKVFLSGQGNWQRGWQYNCLDVLSTATAYPKQMAELIKQGNLATYERQRRLIPPLTYMMEHGIRVDKSGMATAAKAAEEEALKLCESISDIIGRPCVANANYARTNNELNLSSPQQLQEYFYNQLNIKSYRNKDSNKPTINETALIRIANKGYQEAKLILRVRKLLKQSSTFLDISQLDSDNRIRCQYNPVGTKFGRISSSANIFGTGTNLQNVPHNVLTYFLADPNYLLYSLDMSQIENRIVAYVGNIGPMIEAFESNIDVHRLTAAMTLNLLGHTRSIETVTSDERQEYGKRPNHAFNYGYGYRAYSLKHEIPERDAKRIHQAYHAIYPQLHSNYWNYVQQELKVNRSLTTIMNRVIPFFGLWSDSLLREAYSAIPQSTCGDHVNERGIEFVYYNTDPLFKPVELLTQIHDSIEIQMPLSVPLTQHAHVLIAIKRSLETPLSWHGRDFVVPIDLTIGKCMNKALGVEVKNKDFTEDITKLVGILEDAKTKLELSCKS